MEEQLGQQDLQVIQASIQQPSNRLSAATYKYKSQPNNGFGDSVKLEFVAKWLTDYYAESLPESHVQRQFIASHLSAYCQYHGVQPIGSATLGKLIKSLFPSVHIRRLGMRGQSKYHYCGLALKSIPGADLYALPSPISPQQFMFSPTINDVDDEQLQDDGTELTFPSYQGQITTPQAGFLAAYQNHLLDLLPMFVESDEKRVQAAHNTFWSLVVTDEVAFLNDFSQFVVMCSVMFYDYVTRKYSQVMQAQYTSYDTDVVACALETTQIRKFCKSIELLGYTNIPKSLDHELQRSSKLFTQYIRRLSTLSHLGSSVRVLLDDRATLALLATDLHKIDLAAIFEQFNLIADSVVSLSRVQSIFQQFENFIAQSISDQKEGEEHPIVKLTEQIRSTIKDQQVYATKQNNSIHPKSMMNGLCKFEVIAGLIQRDLVVRSSPGAESFQLLKLFTSEYLFHHFESKMCQQV